MLIAKSAFWWGHPPDCDCPTGASNTCRVYSTHLLYHEEYTTSRVFPYCVREFSVIQSQHEKETAWPSAWFNGQSENRLHPPARRRARAARLYGSRRACWA